MAETFVLVTLGAEPSLTFVLLMCDPNAARTAILKTLRRTLLRLPQVFCL